MIWNYRDPLRVVIDTNVLFEGITKRNSTSRTIIDAWLVTMFRVYTSNALAYEYVDVLARKLSARRWHQIKPVLGTLLKQAWVQDINFVWRPISPDPGDDHVIDCAMNANASVITLNTKDFQTAKTSLGLRVLTPTEFTEKLEEDYSSWDD